MDKKIASERLESIYSEHFGHNIFDDSSFEKDETEGFKCYQQGFP